MNSDTPRILVIAGDGEQSKLIAQALAGRRPPWNIEFVTLGAAALDRLARESIDVSLVNHHLADMNGLELLRQIVHRGLDTSVVFIGAFGDETMASEAMRGGADDCIQKSELIYASLEPILRKCAGIQKIRREVRATQHELIRRERQAALSQLSLTLRHEINNPLAALCGYSELLLAQLKDQPDLRRRVQQIYDEAMRIRDVVRKTEHVRDEVEEYQPGLKMIRLRDPGESPAGEEPKP